MIRRLFIAALLVALAAGIGCGKKGNPTLKAFEKPQAPSGLRAILREQTAILQWDYPSAASSSISGFEIFRSDGDDLKELTRLSPSDRIFIDPELHQGATYRYTIVALSASEISSERSGLLTLAVGPVPAAPAAPLFRIEGDRLTVSWTQAGTVSGFNIYRTEEKGRFPLLPVNRALIRAPHFTDSTAPQKTVSYAIRAIGGSAEMQESAASPEITIGPADFVPSAPKNLQAHAAEDRILLSWDEPGERWVTGYRIYRTMDGKAVLVGETQIPAFVDSDKTATPRDYRVTAVGPVSEGPGAEIKAVRPALSR